MLRVRIACAILVGVILDGAFAVQPYLGPESQGAISDLRDAQERLFPRVHYFMRTSSRPSVLPFAWHFDLETFLPPEDIARRSLDLIHPTSNQSMQLTATRRMFRLFDDYIYLGDFDARYRWP
jgi:hypothetical protein